MNNFNRFQTGFKYIETLDGEEAIPDRFLKGSPKIPDSIMEILDEYIVRHFFVTCPFKATQEQKTEYKVNVYRCKELRDIINNTGYIGTFAVLRYEHILLIQREYTIDEWGTKSDKPELNFSWVRPGLIDGSKA